MPKVTVKWRNGAETSFTTADAATIARYRKYVDTDPGINEVDVADDTEPEPDA
jgi:hypothetical protein